MTVAEFLGTPPADLLEWDTAFFGRRIARARARSLTPSSVLELLGWCAAQRVDCVYFLADAADGLTIGLAETHGFRCVDIRVTLENRNPATNGPPGSYRAIVRDARPADVAALKEIARTGFRQGRFHFDRRFPSTLADRLYEVWIEKSCEGAADVVLVADVEERPAGFVTCHLQADAIGQIGLAAVSGHHRGHGLGRALVTEALRWLEDHGTHRTRVVTQGRNRAALRLYEQCGFLTESVELYYHRWFEAVAA